MKTIANKLLLLICVIILFSFIHKSPHEDYGFFELRHNETILFKDGPVSAASYKKGAYDMSGYEMKLTNNGNIIIKARRECLQKNQSQIDFLNCHGSVTGNLDTLSIIARSNYSNFYIISIEKKEIVEKFSSNIKITLLSKTLKNEFCPNLVFNSFGLMIVAIPKGVNIKEFFAPVHEDNTIGVFSYFQVSDSTGQSRNYPAGDYVITGGNSLKIKE